MTVPEQIPYVGYVANGQSTDFPITFDLHDPEYLVVTLNKEIPALGTYSIDMNALKVVFATAPKSGDQIELYRETELNRDIDYKSYDNSFRPEVVNYDFDKIMHILQEQQMINAETLAKIKAEIEWRRTHDANFDELAKMRDAQIFSGLKQYIDTITAASNPNIFEGVTAGVVFALDKKSVQTHLEIIYNALSANREEALEAITEESERALASEENLFNKISEESTRAVNAETAIQNQLNSLGGGMYGFATYAAFDAVKGTVPAHSVVQIDEVNNTGTGQWAQGLNIWDGSILKKSSYDVLQLANLQARMIAIEEALRATANLIITDSSKLFQFPDSNGDIVASVNEYGEFEAPNFKTESGNLESVAQVVTNQDFGDFTHLEYDSEGNILFGTRMDGSFTAANPSLKFGLSDLRAGSVPASEIQALGIALDQNATETDTPYSFEIEVSPYQADGTQAQRMATAIKIGPNKLYVAFTQFSVYNNDQQDGRLVARIVDYDLVNKTATVSATIPIIGNTTGNNYRHPHFIRLKDRILLIFNGNTPDLLVYESLDNCATWQLKTQIPTTTAEPWALALDSVVRIEEGPYAGRIVMALFNSPSVSKLGTVYSDDNGVTWKRGVTINNADHFPTYPNLNETSLACDAHNDLIFAIRNETLAAEARYIIFAKSTDGGHSFQFFSQNIKTPTVGVQIGMKQIAPNSFNGGVPKIIATHPMGNNRTQFILRVSYDGCQSWAYDYKPWLMSEMVGYSSLVPLSAKDYALVVEKGPMLKEQSIAIKFLNLKEIM
ncbi:exo-alpha-sialidase [Acinetobacter baumannii]|uniref:exo-alpha-sialidase n=1 Tax=Acinetobacter baumannii TaxID=470 RepID=UPI001F2AE8F0|nr:exo-alpha-sialidase [Acinetobacter baumannii]UJX48839.1 exo-alpha-sialidase [Acinetobacter baumannii]